MSELVEVTIEKGVPVPPKKVRRCQYPLDEMNVGDSFAIPISHDIVPAKRLRSNMHNSITRYRNRVSYKSEFITRTVFEGGKLKLRVWRTA